MAGCKDKTQRRCKTVFGACVEWQKTPRDISSLAADDCNNIEDVTEDIYDILEGIKEEIDLTGLDADCLSPLPVDNNTKKMFQFLITTICNMQSTIETIQGDLTTAQAEISDLQNNICD